FRPRRGAAGTDQDGAEDTGTDTDNGPAAPDRQVAAETSGRAGETGRPVQAAHGAHTVTAEQATAPEQPLTAQELDRSADELRELLDQGIAAAERRLFELRTAAADDSRILGALGDGGLLPPGPDVLATVEYLGPRGDAVL
ncbi:hypothetical protein, partial [Streptomyces sanglieri]|uniref:hypothetical protein n=1 Tax=Streptomyces sanglieri TaxID=193460 RepID=UPI003526633A